MMARDANQQGMLHHFVRDGRIELLLWAFEQCEKDAKTMLEWHDRWSRTPLHWAVLNDRLPCVEVLLQHGAKLDPYKVPQARHGRVTRLIQESPLEIAIRKYGENAEITRLLRGGAK